MTYRWCSLYSFKNIMYSVWFCCLCTRRGLSSDEPPGGQQLLRPSLPHAKVFLQWGEQLFVLTLPIQLRIKWMKRKSYREIFGLQTKMHNKNRVNRIKTIKGHTPESTGPGWMAVSVLTVTRCCHNWIWMQQGIKRQQHEDVKPICLQCHSTVLRRKDLNVHHIQQLVNLKVDPFY